MTYDDARAAMKRGHKVRRALWDTYVAFDARGQARWQLPEHLTGEYPDTIYVPTRIDANADDWEAAKQLARAA